MANLLEDIEDYSERIVSSFKADGIMLNYTIESLKEIDKFFDLNSSGGIAVAKSRLSEHLGQKLFAIGSYLGQTLVKNIPGARWQTDDGDPNGEITAEVILPNDTRIWPIEKVVKRFQNGQEDSVYPYAELIVRQYSKKDWWM